MRRTMLTTLAALLAGLLTLSSTAPASATVPWTGASTTTLTFSDTTTGVKITCSSGTQRGLATALPSGPLNNVTASTWTGCAVTSAGITVTQAGTWTVGPTSVTGISLHFSGAGSFTLTGSAAASYVSSTQTFTYSGATAMLTSSSVTGCSGLIANTNTWKFAGSYHL